jgi:hypothetical protein
MVTRLESCATARRPHQLVRRVYVTQSLVSSYEQTKTMSSVLRNRLNYTVAMYLAIKTYSKYGGKATRIQNLGPEWRCETPIAFPLHPFGARWVGIWVGFIGSGT